MLTDDSRTLGFLLLTGEEPLDQGAGRREAVITAAPAGGAAPDAPESEFLDDHRNAEWTVSVTPLGLTTHLEVQLPQSRILMSLTDDGTGRWNVDLQDGTRLRGRCEVVRPVAD